MRILDFRGPMRYEDGDSPDVTVMDLIDSLKEQLMEEEQRLAKATLRIKQLKVAIAALERDAAAQADAVEGQRPTRKRGAVSKAVLDCLRQGIGTVALIKKTLMDKGVTASSNSISNAINRLQARRVVAHDAQLGRWVVIDSEFDHAENDKAPH